MYHPWIAVLAAVVVGCATTAPPSPAEGPRRAVQGYYDALMAGDHEAAYALMSSADRAAVSLANRRRDHT